MLKKDDAEQLGQHVAALVALRNHPGRYDDCFADMCSEVENLEQQLLVCVAARLIASDGYARTELYIQRMAHSAKTAFAESMIQVVEAAAETQTSKVS